MSPPAPAASTRAGSPRSWRSSAPPTSPAASSAPSPSSAAPPGAAPPTSRRVGQGRARLHRTCGPRAPNREGSRPGPRACRAVHSPPPACACGMGHTGPPWDRYLETNRRVRMTTATPPAPTTLGGLRASGHRHKEVKHELRANLLARLADGGERFPGIVGCDDTVLPELERALLAGHDIVLLGERGQGKTRLIRSLHHLLDEWTPVVAGCEINDHPYVPTCVACRARLASDGDELPVAWRHRSERYGEKLATPDTSVGDLIGDIDPIKVAEGRTLGDPETVHYGLVPRT